MDERDEDLIRRVRAGEIDAFGELVSRYQQWIYGLAYHRVGHFADAQDIAQETFVQAYRNLSRLRQPERFPAWLKAIAINESRAWLRKRRYTAPLDEAETASPESWEREARRMEVRQAVESLPPADRLAVILHYLSGLSYLEISNALKVPVGVIEGRLYRARKHLRRELIGMVEESLTRNRLSDSFTEGVLREISLSFEGWQSASFDDRVYTLIMGVSASDGPGGIIALTMARKDGLAVMPPEVPEDRAAQAKAQAFDSFAAILKSLDIRLKEAVLWLDESRECRSGLVFQKGRSSRSVTLPASDGLALAARMGAPVLAEEAVIRQGKVSEGGLACPFSESLEAMMAELRASRPFIRLQSKGFDIGLSPEEGRPLVRYTTDESAGTLTIAVPGSGSEPAVLDLAENRSALERLRDIAGQSHDPFYMRNGRRYRARFRRTDGGLEIEFRPEKAEGIDR